MPHSVRTGCQQDKVIVIKHSTRINYTTHTNLKLVKYATSRLYCIISLIVINIITIRQVKLCRLNSANNKCLLSSVQFAITLADVQFVIMTLISDSHETQSFYSHSSVGASYCATSSSIFVILVSSVG